MQRVSCDRYLRRTHAPCMSRFYCACTHAHFRMLFARTGTHATAPTIATHPLEKYLEIFDKNSADKIQSKNFKGGKSALSHAN